MSQQIIDDMFQTLQEIRETASPELKVHFDKTLEDFCRSVLGRELKIPSKIADMEPEQRAKVREQNRARQERARQRKADGPKGP